MSAKFLLSSYLDSLPTGFSQPVKNIFVCIVNCVLGCSCRNNIRSLPYNGIRHSIYSCNSVRAWKRIPAFHNRVLGQNNIGKSSWLEVVLEAPLHTWVEPATNLVKRLMLRSCLLYELLELIADRLLFWLQRAA